MPLFFNEYPNVRLLSLYLTDPKWSFHRKALRQLNGRDVHPWFGAGGEGILQALLVGVGLAKDLTGIQTADGWPLGRVWVPRGKNALWSMGPWGARKLPGHGIAKGEGTLPCEWCNGDTVHPVLTDLRNQSGNHTLVCIVAGKQVMGKHRTAGGDATGNAQRVPLAKLCGTTTHSLRLSLSDAVLIWIA